MTIDNNHLITAEWRNSASICALSDGERHYGHIVKIDGRWYAFDATHLDREGSGFRRLGSYASTALPNRQWNAALMMSNSLSWALPEYGLGESV